MNNLDDIGKKMVSSFYKEELATAKGLLRDFKIFPSCHFGRKVDLHLDEISFSVVEDALELFIDEKEKKLKALSENVKVTKLKKRKK